MRVLVISHNVFDYTTSMGKTLSKLFEGCQDIELAQLYIHNEAPGSGVVCANYYQITDKEALKSVFTRNRIGAVYSLHKEEQYTTENETSTIEERIYQNGRKRTPLIYIARDLMWSLSNWNNPKLKDWLDDFNPEVIFLASGDYEFIYKIASCISNTRKIDLVTMCFDDYYIFNRNENSLIGRLRQRKFLKTVFKTLSSSKCIITVCNQMAEDYKKIFNKKCHVLYTPAEQVTIPFKPNANRIAYFGSLGLGRSDQLIEIGKALMQCRSANKPVAIDVFSSEPRKEILDKMTEENGIVFHHAVSPSEMKDVLSECISVIHTESFDPVLRKRTQYSISTKIAESLAFGPCLFAYGPEGIASIEYLKSHNAAVVVTHASDLVSHLNTLLESEDYRNGVIENARKLARKNHNQTTNSRKLYSWLTN